MQRITHHDILFFLRQLATLITAGISLLTACDILQAAQSKTSLRLLIHQIKRELLQGKSLSTTLTTNPHLFDPFSVTLIQLSEHTGQIAEMLCLVADYLEKSGQFKKRLRQLLFYPSLVFCSTMLMALCMLIFIVPHFAALFQTLTAPLPLLTRLLFSASFFLLNHAFLIIFIFLALATVFYFMFKKNKRHLWQHYLKKLPILSTYHKQLNLLQFMRHTAMALHAGLPLTESIRLAANTTHDTTFISHAKHIQHTLERGHALHIALKHTQHFPLLLIEMVKTGEESGMLTAMLNKMADFLESELNQRVQQIQTLVEPLIILILGALIGGLVIGMYLPIFKLGSAL